MTGTLSISNNRPLFYSCQNMIRVTNSFFSPTTHTFAFPRVLFRGTALFTLRVRSVAVVRVIMALHVLKQLPDRHRSKTVMVVGLQREYRSRTKQEVRKALREKGHLVSDGYFFFLTLPPVINSFFFFFFPVRSPPLLPPLTSRPRRLRRTLRLWIRRRPRW